MAIPSLKIKIFFPQIGYVKSSYPIFFTEYSLHFHCTFCLMCKKKIYFIYSPSHIFYSAVLADTPYAFFVLAAIPTVSYAFSLVLISSKTNTRFEQYRKIMYGVIILLCVLFSSAFIFNAYYQVFDKNKLFGVGFDEPQKRATDFVLKSKLKGNLFNNFDIGGYAIYRLFPTYKVFVDNRPEAYPVEFFKKSIFLYRKTRNYGKRCFVSMISTLFSFPILT